MHGRIQQYFHCFQIEQHQDKNNYVTLKDTCQNKILVFDLCLLIIKDQMKEPTPRVSNQVCYSEHQQELNPPQHLSKGSRTLEHKHMLPNMK